MPSTNPPKPTFTIKSHPPLHIPLTLPTPSDTSPATNPPIFNDAMKVRLPVFCDEQKCSLTEELDADDIRSWQWVIYASSSPASGTTGEGAEVRAVEGPVACIRLVPPPHAPHETLLHPEQAREGKFPKYDVAHEPYVKITRVAVLKDYRGFGLSRLLMDTVHQWIEAHGEEIEKEYRRELRAYLGGDEKGVYPGKWNGLCLTHAQVQVEKMYERFGYKTDKTLGVWDEEGIDHIGMFRRLDVTPHQ